jgi:hypothetical protein
VSEYQYYEFLAIDHPLTKQQRAELQELSTRAEITATSFVNEYRWGDFHGDPHVLMERYFDAFLYYANFGTRRLMFRVPLDSVDLKTAEQYCRTEAASVTATDDHLERREAEEARAEHEERQRRAAATAAASAKHLDELVGREPQMWQKVDRLTSRTVQSEYDEALALPKGPAGPTRT